MYICTFIVELRICRNTVIDSVFIHRKSKTNGNSEVFAVHGAENGTIYRTVFLYYARQKPLQIAMFLLAAAKKNAIYNVFEHPLKKHRYLRRLQQHSRRKHRYLRFFLHFRAKPSSLGNGQEHCKNQRFCPTKTAKTIPKQL